MSDDRAPFTSRSWACSRGHKGGTMLKACFLSLVALLCVASLLATERSVEAQPTATSTTQSAIPLEPPGNMDPTYWAKFRQQCIEMFAAAAQAQQMTPEQRRNLKPRPAYEAALREPCLHHGSLPSPPAVAAPAGNQPTPRLLPTPVPSTSNAELSAQIATASTTTNLVPGGKLKVYEGAPHGLLFTHNN